MSSMIPATVPSNTHPAASLKAIIATVGAIAASVVGMFAAASWEGKVLTGVIIVTTAVGTYMFPNAAVEPEGEDTSPASDPVPDEQDTPLPDPEPEVVQTVDPSADDAEDDTEPYDDGFDPSATDEPGTPLVPGEGTPDDTGITHTRSDLP